MASSRATTLVAGVDLGGTNIGIGVVDSRNRVVGRERRKTKAKEGADAVIERIAEGVQRACDDAGVGLRDIAAVGIATAGAIDIPNGIVLEAPNLKWYDLPLRDRLQKKLKRPIIVDNDVNGAVWGEFHLGAGKTLRARSRERSQHDDVLGVWMGTGVGGGLVLQGRLFHGEFFTAGEVGHMVVVPHGRKGRRTVEDFCSRTGMSRTIQERLAEFPKSMLHKLTEGTGKVTGSKQLAKAYRAGDKLAVQVVNEAADMLGMAIANIITVLAIDTTIIGGGVAEALGKPYVRRIHNSFKQFVFPKRCQECRFVLTELKDDAGLLGAALLARQTL